MFGQQGLLIVLISHTLEESALIFTLHLGLSLSRLRVIYEPLADEFITIKAVVVLWI